MSSETADLGTEAPAEQEPANSNAVRGWQSLAEKRGQELAEARAKLATYEAADKARQLADEYPDAAELTLREGGQLSSEVEGTLAAMQRAIEATRATRPSLIDPNNPRRSSPIRREPTADELVDQLRSTPLPSGWDTWNRR